MGGYLRLLREDQAIDIYAWADSGMHRIGDLHLNYAAGLEDSIIRIVAPLWNGARSLPLADTGSTLSSPSAVEYTESMHAKRHAPLSTAQARNESASASEMRALETAGVIRASPVFEVKLGKTYYHHGFFNVPVKFSGLFPDHGSEISIYCGGLRSLIRATIDRRANQTSHTPRIYGRGSLAKWFDLYKRQDDIATIRVVSTNEIELM